MKKWLVRFGRAALLGLLWGAAWVPFGALAVTLIVGELEPEHIGGALYPGFLCGAMFSLVAGIGDGRRRLAEMSLARASASGSLGGLLGGALWLVALVGGVPTQWLYASGVVGGLTIASALSGVASALLARMGQGDAQLT